MEKIASFHRMSDKGMNLISIIAYLTDSVRYKNSLLIAVEKITDSDSEDSEKIDVIETPEGYKL